METPETLIFRIFEKKFKLFAWKKKEKTTPQLTIYSRVLMEVGFFWVPHIFGCHWDEINGLVSYGSMLIKGYTPCWLVIES